MPCLSVPASVIEEAKKYKQQTLRSLNVMDTFKKTMIERKEKAEELMGKRRTVEMDIESHAEEQQRLEAQVTSQSPKPTRTRVDFPRTSCVYNTLYFIGFFYSLLGTLICTIPCFSTLLGGPPGSGPAAVDVTGR